MKNVESVCNTIWLGDGKYHMLDRVNDNAFMKIYCACGKIVELDKNDSSRKISLGKSVQCIICRNLRISGEIDELNRHFETDEIIESF